MKTKVQEYTPFIREALEGNDMTDDRLACMSQYDIFQMTLEWHGIIGYSGSILRALEDLGLKNNA